MEAENKILEESNANFDEDLDKFDKDNQDDEQEEEMQ